MNSIAEPKLNITYIMRRSNENPLGVLGYSLFIFTVLRCPDVLNLTLEIRAVRIHGLRFSVQQFISKGFCHE